MFSLPPLPENLAVLIFLPLVPAGALVEVLVCLAQPSMLSMALSLRQSIASK